MYVPQIISPIWHKVHIFCMLYCQQDLLSIQATSLVPSFALKHYLHHWLRAFYSHTVLKYFLSIQYISVYLRNVYAMSIFSLRSNKYSLLSWPLTPPSTQNALHSNEKYLFSFPPPPHSTAVIRFYDNNIK